MKALVVAMGMSLAAVPVAAAPIPTGFARITVDEGCLARVVKGPYKKVVSGRTELPTGTYRIQVRPSTCTANKKRITVRQGKVVKARVVNTTPTPTPTPTESASPV